MSPSADAAPPARRRRRTSTAQEGGRERILAAAIRAFSEVGYAGASTAGIARDAGVAQPLVHHHFGSKEGLWRAAVDAVFSHIPRLPPAAAAAASPEASLLAAIDAFVHFVADHPQATRIVSREGATPSPRLDYLLDRYLHEPFREVVDALRAAQAAGAVAPDLRPELCLFLILGAGSHLFDIAALARQSQGIDTRSAWTRDTFAAHMRALLLGGIVRAKD